MIMVGTVFVILMQLGFALIECGLVRSKNAKNILIKNLFDACIGALAFWAVGFGLAFGQKEPGGFIGTNAGMFFASEFHLDQERNLYLLWIFHFSFAATASTIISGSLAERTQLPAYMGFSTLMTGFVYPIIVGWCWGGGWLGDAEGAEGKSLRMHDFAGTGIVHLVGGVAGFIGAAVVGPRFGKEKNATMRRNALDLKETEEWLNMQTHPD